MILPVSFQIDSEKGEHFRHYISNLRQGLGSLHLCFDTPRLYLLKPPNLSVQECDTPAWTILLIALRRAASCWKELLS